MHRTLKVVEQPGLILALPALFFDYGATVMGHTPYGQSWHPCGMSTDVQLTDTLQAPSFCTRDCGHDGDLPGLPNDPIHLSHDGDYVVAAWMETVAPLPSVLDPRIVRSLSELTADGLLGRGNPYCNQHGPEQPHYSCTRQPHDDLLHVADTGEAVIAAWLAVKA